MIKQLEPVVSARRQDPHVVETETAVLDADKEWKYVTAAQLFKHVLVDTFHIDLEVVRHTEFVEQTVERDAFDSDLAIFTGVSGGPSHVKAAPVIVAEVDVKSRLAARVPDGGVENSQAPFLDCSVESLLRSFTQRRIRIERNDIKSTLQIEVRVVAIVKSEIKYDTAVFGVARHFPAAFSLGIA